MRKAEKRVGKYHRGPRDPQAKPETYYAQQILAQWQASGLTQEEFARTRLRRSRTTMNNWLAERTLPRGKEALKILRRLVGEKLAQDPIAREMGESRPATLPEPKAREGKRSRKAGRNAQRPAGYQVSGPAVFEQVFMLTEEEQQLLRARLNAKFGNPPSLPDAAGNQP